MFSIRRSTPSVTSSTLRTPQSVVAASALPTQAAVARPRGGWRESALYRMLPVGWLCTRTRSTSTASESLHPRTASPDELENQTANAAEGATVHAAEGTSLPSRMQVGADLIDVVHSAAIAKTQTLVALEKIPGRRRTSQQKADIEQLTFDIGERMRLKGVLEKFLQTPSQNSIHDTQPIETALHAHYDRVNTEAVAGHAAQDVDDALSISPTEKSGPVVFDRAAEMQSLHWAAENKDKSGWLTRHQLVMVENGGADNKTQHDEGNNCLIVALLQHASGNYEDRFHQDMARILREGMVALFSRELMQDADINDTPHTVALFSNSESAQWLVQTINTLYGRKLEPHWLALARGQGDTVVESVCNYSGAPCEQADVERVLIWQRLFHYEAVVPAYLRPKPPPETALEKAESVTAKRLTSWRSRTLEAVFDGLDHERREVVRLIDIQRHRSKEHAEELSQRPRLVRQNADVTATLQRIADEHEIARCHRESRLLKDRFNYRVGLILDRLEERLQDRRGQRFKEIIAERINIA